MEKIKRRIQKKYNNELRWNRIVIILKNQILLNFPIDISFVLKNNLIYYIRDNKNRLYLFQIFEKDIFEAAYNRQAHVEFYRIFQRIAEIIYLHNLIKRLRRYILKCPIYKTHQIKRHALYGQLILIILPRIPFHIIVINFIINLLKINGLNTILSITNKFIKQILLISNKKIYTAED
jgi:hypothetical protein